MNADSSQDRKKIEALIKVCTAVNKHLELNDVLSAIMSVTTEIMKVETSSLAIEDKETGDILFHTTCGEGVGKIEHIRIKPGEGIIGCVTKTGEPAVVNDAQNDKRFCKKVDNESGFVTRSILCVPLKTTTNTLGAIEVINTTDNRDFTDIDTELCEAIAGQAAIAIENALLHEDIVKNERMAAIGQTITSLGHCIKNVLHGIGAGAYVVDKGIEKDDMTNLAKGWRIVKKNNEFMHELVLDMLTYSKERVPAMETCNINELMKSVCEIVTEKASQKDVTLICKKADGFENIVVDPKEIKRCILNLVSNGIDACENRSGEKSVTVSANRIDDNSFNIKISDTGCGIPEDKREKMFKMFFSTKGNKGTGLGLAVTKKIIEEHGGNIDFESEPEKGTTFIITLPQRALPDKT